MEIISRARWGARYSAGFGPAPLPARELWLHHSVTIAPDLVWVDADGDGVEDDEERAMRTLDDIGQQRFGGGISYTFAVMPSGRIYEGHGVGRQGAHTGGRNDIARAIVLVGDYSSRPPTEAQKRAVAWLVVYGHRQGWWTVAGLSGGHRQAPKQIATACPGDAALADIPEINQIAAAYLRGEIDPSEEDDLMAFENEIKSTYGTLFGHGGDRSRLDDLLDEVRAIKRQVTPNPDGSWPEASTTGNLANDVASTYQATGANIGAVLPILLGKVTTPDVEIDAEDITRLADELRRTLPGDVAAELGRKLTTKEN